MVQGVLWAAAAARLQQPSHAAWAPPGPEHTSLWVCAVWETHLLLTRRGRLWRSDFLSGFQEAWELSVPGELPTPT